MEGNGKQPMVDALASLDPMAVKKALRLGRASVRVVLDNVLSLAPDDAATMWKVLFRSEQEGGDTVDFATPALKLVRDLKVQHPTISKENQVLPCDSVLQAAFAAHDFVLSIYFDKEPESCHRFVNDFVLPLLYLGDGGSEMHLLSRADAEAATISPTRPSSVCEIAVDTVRAMEMADQAAYPAPYSNSLAGCCPAAVMAAKCRDMVTEQMYREVRLLVVGPAGAGKTTFVSSLLGFDETQQRCYHDKVVSDLRESGTDVPEPDLSSDTRTFIPYSVVYQVDGLDRPEPVPVGDVTEYIRMQAREGQVKVTLVDSPGCTRDLMDGAQGTGPVAESGLPAYGAKVMEEIEATHPLYGFHGPLGGVIWVVHAIEARVQSADQQFIRWLDRVGLPITFVCTFAFAHPKTVERYIQNVEKEKFRAIRAFVPVQSRPEDPTNVLEGEAGWHLTLFADTVSKVYHDYPPVTFIANPAARVARVKEIIHWGVARAGACGLIPLPFVDNLAAAVSNVKMVSDILACYPRGFREAMRPVDVIYATLWTPTFASPTAFLMMSAIGVVDLMGDGLKAAIVPMAAGAGLSVGVHLILSVILGHSCLETFESIVAKNLPEIRRAELELVLRERGQSWIKRPMKALATGRKLAKKNACFLHGRVAAAADS